MPYVEVTLYWSVVAQVMYKLSHSLTSGSRATMGQCTGQRSVAGDGLEGGMAVGSGRPDMLVCLV